MLNLISLSYPLRSIKTGSHSRLLYPRWPELSSRFDAPAELLSLLISLACIAVGAHRALATAAAGVRCVRLVDRMTHVRGIEPVAVLIVVEEQAALQHLVGGGTDARYGVRRIEGRLSNFSETGSVIRIQHDSASEQISRSASSLCFALVTKSKPVEALGRPAPERPAARSACAARVDRFRSSSARRPGYSYFLRGLRAAWLRRHALIRAMVCALG